MIVLVKKFTQTCVMMKGMEPKKAGLNIYNQETNKTLSKTEADYNLLTQQQLKRN